MRSSPTCSSLLLMAIALLLPHGDFAGPEPALISIDASSAASKPIPSTLFGAFFEEINHAGVGGLWADLVINRGFEASPGDIKPWGVMGDKNSIRVSTDLSSCFESNKVALRMDVLCDGRACPNGAVGVYNPGYGGMNIEQGKRYKVTLYSRGSGPYELTISFTSSDGKQVLGLVVLSVNDGKAGNWRRTEVSIVGEATNRNSRLQIAANKRGTTVWIDQVSAMPIDTHLGHGFRKDLMQMLLDLRPRFLRFPGGCFVEGDKLKNAFRWKQTIGPWEERPGHYGDVWHYWTDDGLGYLEYLQLAEDLGATPVWVINVGISHSEQVNTTLVDTFVLDMLDSIEFARGDKSSGWGSLRARFGHPEPFVVKYVAIGNENCMQKYPTYTDNYMKFYKALKGKYPDIEVITNCDATSQRLGMPADLFDFHLYTNPSDMFTKARVFDHLPRPAPKVFVSEYAVTSDANGTLIGALAEAAFLIGLERNSDIVAMASYAPLFMHRDDPAWKPDAILFDSWRSFGIPSYWMQTFFTDSSGATLLNVTQSTNDGLVASAISYKSSKDQKDYIKIKVVNFESSYIPIRITLDGVNPKSIKGFKQTVLTSDNPNDLNSFDNPTKVTPKSSTLHMTGNELNASLKPYSLTAFDLLQVSRVQKAKAEKLDPVEQSSSHGRKLAKILKSNQSISAMI